MVSLTPSCAHRVADGGGSYGLRIVQTISSSKNFDRFMGPLLSCETAEAAIIL